MDVILLKDIEKVGEKHTIVSVKNGYGRNYLIPQGMAIVANETNRSRLDDLRRKEEEEAAARLADVQQIAEKLEGQVLKIGAKAGTSGKIFGSVTNIQLAQALKDQLDIDVDRRLVVMPEEIKELGSYHAELDLHSDLDIKVYFEVFAE